MNRSIRSRTGRQASWIVALGMALLVTAVFAPGAQARTEGFESLAPTPGEFTSVAADAATGLVYAQENQGTVFFSYDPRTNEWTEMAPSPVNSGNNGGAAYLDGKIYASYTGNGAQVAVYDIATNSWTTIPNPLGEGTGAITAGDGNLYMTVGQHFVSYDPTTETTTTLAEPPELESECEVGFEAWGGIQFTGDKIYGDQGDGCRGFAVYDIASNSWTELPLVPLVEGEEEEGAVLGSAYDPVSDTYFAYGPYGGHLVYRFDINSGTWSTSALPFTGIDDGGMGYVSLSGYEGVYMIQGQEGPEFARYTERLESDLGISISADAVSSADGGTITYSIPAQNAGPDSATGVVVTDPLPAGTSLGSATASQGSCTGTSTITCSIGALPSGASATVTIKVTAGFGTYKNAATVSTESLDTNPANDSADIVSTFTKPSQAAVGTKTTTTTKPPSSSAALCRLPKKLRSRSLSGAKKALRKGHCKPGKLLYHNGDKITRGRVIGGGKRRSSTLPSGSKIRLTISLGRQQR